MKGNFLVIVMVIIALMACKTDSDPDPECNCAVKAHLASGETCKCGLANCGCTLKPTCECPNGTIHFSGDTLICKSENNCFCEHGNFTGSRVQGFAVTNRENVTNLSEMVIHIETAFSYFAPPYSNDPNVLIFAKANIKEIKVVTGNIPASISGSVLTVGNSSNGWSIPDDIGTVLDYYYEINQ